MSDSGRPMNDCRRIEDCDKVKGHKGACKPMSDERPEGLSEAEILSRAIAFLRSLELDGYDAAYEQGDCIAELETLARREQSTALENTAK